MNKYFKPTNVTATFVGEDGSCGFKKWKTYDVWMFYQKGKFYVSERSVFATAIPYDSWKAVTKNWAIKRMEMPYVDDKIR